MSHTITVDDSDWKCSDDYIVSVQAVKSRSGRAFVQVTIKSPLEGEVKFNSERLIEVVNKIDSTSSRVVLLACGDRVIAITRAVTERLKEIHHALA